MAVGSRSHRVLTHALVIAALLLIMFPVYMAFTASTHTLTRMMQKPAPLVPGNRLIENYIHALTIGAQTAGAYSPSVLTMLKNSLIMAVGITLGKIVVSFLAAYAIVYFDWPGRKLFFWLVLVTLMLPVEVRILPTYKVMADLRMLDTYTGLILPLTASATATFFFRQFFKAVPDQLTEAAVIDGAGPLRFMTWILAPVTRTTVAALVVIQFIYGWNQYLWPLLITTKPQFQTLLIGIANMLKVGDHQAEWHIIMAATIVAMLPPVIVVVAMQKQFIEGMTETEK